MSRELQELKQRQEEASVAKRVAEQMEEIAHDQRMLSDAQRDSAEKQRHLAEDYAREAERESRLAHEAETKANEARNEAVIASQQATRERHKAEEKEQEAIRAKNSADTLSYRNLARSLGSASILARSGGNTVLARQLAYTAWHFQKKYDEDVYQAEVFKALMSDDAQEQMTPHHSAIYDVDVSTDGKAVMACSGYGEIMRWEGGRLRTLFWNKRYDFRSMVQARDYIWALDFNGSICKIGYNGMLEEYTLPAGEYFFLQWMTDGKLLASARHHVASFDVNTHKSHIMVEKRDRMLRSTALTSDEALFFYDDGSVGSITLATEQFRMKKTPITEVVTTAYFDAEGETMYVGLQTGGIAVVKKDGKLQQMLVGHTAAVTEITLLKKEHLLVSAGRDKEVHIWDLDRVAKPGRVLSTSYSVEGWPLCTAAIGSQLACGMSTGKLSLWELSPERLAQATYERIDKGLTPEEWNNFVGTQVPYVKLK